MPSKSQKQHDFMQQVYDDADFRDRVKVPKKVAKEFLDEDKAAGLWQDSKESRSVESLRDARFEENYYRRLHHTTLNVRTADLQDRLGRLSLERAALASKPNQAPLLDAIDGFQRDVGAAIDEHLVVVDSRYKRLASRYEHLVDRCLNP